MSHRALYHAKAKFSKSLLRLKVELSSLLEYQNPKVLQHFCQQNAAFSEQEAHILLKDLLGWMWLKQKRAARGKKTYLFGPLLVLDTLWHTFILHTRDYLDFSLAYFGTYFHHDVEPVGFEHCIEEEELRDFLGDCLTFLGEEWVARRFAAALSSAID